MNWDWVGIVSALTAAVLGYLGLRASGKKDAASKQSGAASDHRADTTQVIEGYQGLLAEMRQGVAEAERRCEERIKDAVDDLKRELTKRPTRDELLDANGRLRKQLLDRGETPMNGLSP